MNMFSTEEEAFWAGEFGEDYLRRNPVDFEEPARIHLFSKILARTRGVRSALEIGANIGNNLRVLRRLMPDAELGAVEINRTAAGILEEWGEAEVFNCSAFDFVPGRIYDLVLFSGVLIHINPGRLHEIYDVAHRACNRYICLAEYYNPTPMEVPYRGHSGRLYKRDFAGEMLERFPDLSLVDYGFVYHRDPNFPLDDITWFLLEKGQ